MKYLVTGGAGFIGSSIAHELIKRGEQVRVIDNFSTGDINNIVDIIDKIELVLGNIQNQLCVQEAMQNIDFVLHQAALPSVKRSVDNPINSNDSNVNGTLNLLVAARDAGVKRFVYASSSSVYGDSEVLPKHEDMELHPISPYAISKLTGEYYCRVFNTIYGLDTVSLRYFNVFGPRQNCDSEYSAVIPKFIKAAFNDDDIIVYGDGEQTRDFTYIDNVVYANLSACKVIDISGKVFNIACSNAVSINTVIHLIGNILGKKIKCIYEDKRLGDVKHSLADITNAGKYFGYLPVVLFNEGLNKTIEWYGRGK